uniref:Uncharacterized protein n=1 Tax=Eutreptiella gymnastica TaxID=73025 RepID=A0A7S1I3I4_9EUGL
MTARPTDDVSGQLREYDIDAGTWKPLKCEGLVGRYNHTASWVVNKMYIVGGAQISKVEHSNELFAVQLDEDKVSVERLPTGPCRQGHSTVVWQDQLVVFGGTDGTQYHNDCWIFDVTDKRWDCKHKGGDDERSTPLPRAYHSCVLSGDAMLLFAGGNREVEFGDCWKMNLRTFTWERLRTHGQCPRPRKGHVACISDVPLCSPAAGTCAPPDATEPGEATGEYGQTTRLLAQESEPKMFVFGGSSSAGPQRLKGTNSEDLDCCYVLGLDSLRWDRIAPVAGKRPSKRSYHAACAFEGKLLVIGGGCEALVSGSLWLFDCKTALAQFPPTAHSPWASGVDQKPDSSSQQELTKESPMTKSDRWPIELRDAVRTLTHRDTADAVALAGKGRAPADTGMTCTAPTHPFTRKVSTGQTTGGPVTPVHPNSQYVQSATLNRPFRKGSLCKRNVASDPETVTVEPDAVFKKGRKGKRRIVVTDSDDTGTESIVPSGQPRKKRKRAVADEEMDSPAALELDAPSESTSDFESDTPFGIKYKKVNVTFGVPKSMTGRDANEETGGGRENADRTNNRMEREEHNQTESLNAMPSKETETYEPQQELAMEVEEAQRQMDVEKLANSTGIHAESVGAPRVEQHMVGKETVDSLSITVDTLCRRLVARDDLIDRLRQQNQQLLAQQTVMLSGRRESGEPCGAAPPSADAAAADGASVIPTVAPQQVIAVQQIWEETLPRNRAPSQQAHCLIARSGAGEADRLWVMWADGSLSVATLNDVRCWDRRACPVDDAGASLPLSRRAMRRLVEDLPQVDGGPAEGAPQQTVFALWVGYSCEQRQRWVQRTAECRRLRKQRRAGLRSHREAGAPPKSPQKEDGAQVEAEAVAERQGGDEGKMDATPEEDVQYYREKNAERKAAKAAQAAVRIPRLETESMNAGKPLQRKEVAEAAQLVSTDETQELSERLARHTDDKRLLVKEKMEDEVKSCVPGDKAEPYAVKELAGSRKRKRVPSVVQGRKKDPDCQHGRPGYYCKLCPGPGICAHGRQRYRCIDCGGKGICEHGRERRQCKDCGGASICAHGRQRHVCKECGGASICEHGRIRRKCRECGGNAFCEHGRQRHACKECGGTSICAHGRERRYCRECGGTGLCEHGKRRYDCTTCKGNRRRCHQTFPDPTGSK